MEYKLIDCYCSVGEKANPVPDVSYAKDDIKKKLESLNVKKAFCFHNAENSNDELREMVSSDDFFIPSYTPDINGGAEKFEKLFTQYNAKMINIKPSLSGWFSDIKASGEYFEIMDKYSAVMMAPVGLCGKEAFESILSSFKKIRLITVNTGFLDITHIKELMKKYKNIHIDTGYTSLLGLEDVVNSFGSERIVFSSYLPETEPTGSLGRLITIKLSDSDKENIAYKNISSFTGVRT